jgi:general secretion pathway protein N
MGAAVADGLRPLTLLLGGAALWALCLLILALGGLGTRFPEPEGAVAPPPVPTVSLKPASSRLGAFSSYAEVGARPLLNEGRQPMAVSADEAAAGGGDLDVTLTSVLITSRLKLAILTDNKDASSRRVQLGQLVEGSGWRLVALQPRQAVLEGPTGQRTLDLRVFDGTSGEAPTPVSASNSPPPGDNNAPPPPAPPPPVVQPKPAVAQNAPPAPAANRPDPNAMSQEEQVEAIRKRIEARRAQMRAEAEAAAANNR